MELKRLYGFSLIELAISITIIGILIVGVLKGQALIDESRVDSAIKLAEDYSEAVKEFKARYRLLPGDMPNPPVNNLLAACAGGGSGNGKIDGAPAAFVGVPGESQCVPELLFKSGMIKVDGTENGFPVIRSPYGMAWVMAVNSSRVVAARGNLYPPSVQHIVEFEGVSCAAAQTIDRKIDNDSFDSGKIVASVTNCVVGGLNDPVPFLGIAVN